MHERFTVHSRFGDADAPTLSAAVRIRAIIGGHITSTACVCCPGCGSENERISARLGILGNGTWYRCRVCGSTFKV